MAQVRRCCSVTLPGLVATSIAVAAPGAAQRGVEFAPFAGIYMPAAHVIDISANCPGFGGPCGEVVKQENAPVVGARVTAWLRGRLALDLSFAYASSGVTRKGMVAEIPEGDRKSTRLNSSH